jgi:hypothetical protein
MIPPVSQHSPSAQVASTPMPQWAAEYRLLRVGERVIKEFRFPAFNQIAILAAFQKEGWPHRIDDPLPPRNDIDPKCRLHDTIKRLNRHHKDRLIRFMGDGTGEGICWEYMGKVSAAFPFDKELKSKDPIPPRVRSATR